MNMVDVFSHKYVVLPGTCTGSTVASHFVPELMTYHSSCLRYYQIVKILNLQETEDLDFIPLSF